MDKRKDLRIGDKVGLMRKGQIYAAYVVWKGDDTVRIVGDDIEAVAIPYSDIACVVEVQAETLPNIYPDTLTENHMYAYTTAISKLREHNLPHWDFQFDHLPQRRGGQCGHRRRIISVTWEYCHRASQEEILDTILHEIAHALTPGHGHDQVWKRKSQSIGCSGERCHSVDMPIRKNARYIEYCDNMCFVQTITRRRKHHGHLICRKCKSKIQTETFSQDRLDELYAIKEEHQAAYR